LQVLVLHHFQLQIIHLTDLTLHLFFHPSHLLYIQNSCASSPGTNPVYEAAARSVGEAIAKSGRKLVYGGGVRGMMGKSARVYLASMSVPSEHQSLISSPLTFVRIRLGCRPPSRRSRSRHHPSSPDWSSCRTSRQKVTFPGRSRSQSRVRQWKRSCGGR
jgi:hypothetical protein